jgi:Tol biopolymer transport system component
MSFMKRYLLLLILLLALVACASEQPTASTPPRPLSPTTINGDTETAEPLSAGYLYYIRINPGQQFLARYDFESGRSQNIFPIPEGGWVSYADLSPDGSQIVLGYAPPPSPTQTLFGYSHLYLLPLDGDEPQLVIPPADPRELFFNPTWSPDGQSLIYIHILPDEAASLGYSLHLSRFDLETTANTQLVPDALWARISEDGAQLVYIPYRGQSHELIVADAAGQNERILIEDGRFEVIDAPLFSPDGQWVYFSAVEWPEPLSHWQRWWATQWWGTQTAAAHDIPSDWWRIPVSGGEPERLTELNLVGLYGDFVGNGRYLAFASRSGLYLLDTADMSVTQLLDVMAGTALNYDG